jgi:hypothetical protein
MQPLLSSTTASWPCCSRWQQVDVYAAALPVAGENTWHNNSPKYPSLPLLCGSWVVLEALEVAGLWIWKVVTRVLQRI